MEALSIVQSVVFAIVVFVLIHDPKIHDTLYWMVVLLCMPLIVVCIKDFIEYVMSRKK
mgnify:CR=1 FL=1